MRWMAVFRHFFAENEHAYSTKVDYLKYLSERLIVARGEVHFRRLAPMITQAEVS
jgi:hypothetical protein